MTTRFYAYSPNRLEFWVRRWELLDALVMCPATAAHHLSTHHHRDPSNARCCPEPEGTKAPSYSWSEFRADIRVAAEALDVFDRTILRFLSAGHTERDIGTIMGVHHLRVHRRFPIIFRTMACALGWSEEMGDVKVHEEDYRGCWLQFAD